MMQGDTFCQKKAILQFWRKMAQKCARCPVVGKKGPQKWKMAKKWRMLQNLCCSCQRTAIENNRGESRRIEENRGESRRIEENRGESRRIEENRGEQENEEETGEKNGNVAKKRQCLTFWLALPSLSSIFTQLSHVSPIFAHLPRFPQFASYSPHFHPFSALFPFVSVFSPSSPHFQQISAVLRLFFHPFSAEFSRSQMFLKRSPSFRPVFPIFHPISPNKQTEFAGEKTRKQYFQEIVPGFSGDFVYVLFHPQNERTPRTRKHIFATHPIR